MIGVPISEGYSEREITKRLAISKPSVCDPVLELQDELRQLAVEAGIELAEPSDHSEISPGSSARLHNPGSGGILHPGWPCQ